MDIEIRLNNALFVRGLISKRDYDRRPDDVAAAIRATFKIDAQRIHALFVGSD